MNPVPKCAARASRRFAASVLLAFFAADGFAAPDS